MIIIKPYKGLKWLLQRFFYGLISMLLSHSFVSIFVYSPPFFFKKIPKALQGPLGSIVFKFSSIDHNSVRHIITVQPPVNTNGV